MMDSRHEMGRAYCMTGEELNTYGLLMERLEGKRPLGRPR
jgi:hypothetical protein